MAILEHVSAVLPDRRQEMVSRRGLFRQFRQPLHALTCEPIEPFGLCEPRSSYREEVVCNDLVIRATGRVFLGLGDLN